MKFKRRIAKKFRKGRKGFFSVKYKRKFYNFNEFKDYDAWARRVYFYRNYPNSFQYKGVEYEPPKGWLKRPDTYWFKDNKKFPSKILRGKFKRSN